MASIDGTRFFSGVIKRFDLVNNAGCVWPFYNEFGRDFGSIVAMPCVLRADGINIVRESGTVGG